MESDRPPQTRTSATDSSDAKLLTIEGQGTSTSFEITVDGHIEMDAPNPVDEATIVSGSSVQGAIETGVQRFFVYGDVTDVTLLNRGGAGPDVVDPEFILE